MTTWSRALWAGMKAHFALKMFCAWTIAAVFFLGYFLLLKFPLSPVTLMPVTAPDRWIAFWPGALWLYASLWVYVSLPPGLLTDRGELLDYYRAMGALSLAGMAVFLLWPTASPRPPIDWVRYPPLGPVIGADDAGNALPSLHAAFAVFSAIWMEQLLNRAGAPAGLRVASACWGLAIVYSTLATRQHVAVDVAAGTLLGGAVAWLHLRWRQSRKSRTTPLPVRARSDAELLEANRSFYDPLWRNARLVRPERFNTWPLVRSLAAQAPRRLEVAPGLRPRLPIAGTQFIDISAPAVARLRESGGDATLGNISTLPFPDRWFDLVCALDIVEHVDDDDRALSELSRVAAPGAAFLLSVPLHPAQWTAFDDFVGHRRRYEPRQLQAKLSQHGLAIEQSAIYGMQPQSSRLRDLGLWFLLHRRERAMWWYNRVFMPLGLHFQSPLALVPGLIDDTKVAEVILVCRKLCAA